MSKHARKLLKSEDSFLCGFPFWSFSQPGGEEDNAKSPSTSGVLFLGRRCQWLAPWSRLEINFKTQNLPQLIDFVLCSLGVRKFGGWCIFAISYGFWWLGELGEDHDVSADEKAQASHSRGGFCSFDHTDIPAGAMCNTKVNLAVSCSVYCRWRKCYVTPTQLGARYRAVSFSSAVTSTFLWSIIIQLTSVIVSHHCKTSSTGMKIPLPRLKQNRVLGKLLLLSFRTSDSGMKKTRVSFAWWKTCRGQDRFWKLERLSFIRLLCEKRALEFQHLFTTGYCMLSLDWSPVSSTYTIRKKYFALHVSATSFRHASWDSSVWIKSKIAVVTVSTRFQHATEILKR